MRARRRHQFIIAAAACIIAVAVVFYVGLFYRWLSRRVPAPPQKSRSARSASELQKARSDFRARFLDPINHLRLAEALYHNGRPVDAFYVMYWARGFFGDEAFLRAHSLVVLYQDRHFLDAGAFDPSAENEARLNKILAASPHEPNTLNYLAHIAASRGRRSEALRLLDSALAAHPDEPGLLYYRGQLASESGDWRAALTHWSRLATANPQAFETRMALEELGRLAQRPASGPGAEEALLAREALEELRRLKPDDPRIYSTLALAIWNRDGIAGARAMVAETLSRQPAHAGAARIEAALALSDGDAQQALRRFTDAWESAPEDLYSAAKLAQLHFKQRADREAALPFYLALYRANPRYDDGEPAEQRIREILDYRREELLRYAQVETLGRLLTSEDASLRAEAAAKAAQFKDPRWIDALAEMLDDDAEIVRHNADYALFQIAKKSPSAVRVRRDEWLQSAQPLVRARALNLFADLEPSETLPLVTRALADPDPAVRLLARVMVLDHYYAQSAPAAKARADYLARETDPAVLALYDRLPPAPAQRRGETPAAGPKRRLPSP
ncbi:MAG TPA: hypothetical protein DEB40_08860 [Elusimicrobia bacterium]|nr:hypothetical protein [Elusimicrobiota bacterium]HBT61838.1 hypothetical protein [Elusimicrobiota bacterium]